MQIIQQDDGTIIINQRKYAEDVLQRFNMSKSNPVSTPIDQYLSSGEESDNEMISFPYRETLGLFNVPGCSY